VRSDSITALVRLDQERPGDARVSALSAADGARRIGDYETLAQALMAIDDAEHHLGMPLTGIHTKEALDVCVANGLRWRESIARQNLGAIAYFGGNWDQALEYFQSGRRVALEAGYALGAAEAEVNLGDILVSCGELDEAEKVLMDAVRVLRASRIDWFAAYGELQLARVSLARGRYGEADAQLSSLVDQFLAIGSRATAFEAMLVLAEVASGSGQFQRALDLVDEGERVAGGNAGPLLARACQQRGSALLGLGRLDECEAVLAVGLLSAREQGLPYDEALVLRVREQLAAARGEVGESAEDSAAASALLAGLGVGS
jgi:tetratricopeptide (TPR) repeat protein